VIGYACNMLREAGALDVWVTGVQMKKGRPGMLVSLLCKPQQEDELAGCCFVRRGLLESGGSSGPGVWRTVGRSV